MGQSVNISKFRTKLERAILTEKQAEAEYEHYYELNRDETGKHVRGPSFSSAAEKAALSRLQRARRTVRQLETYWNNLYNLWMDYEMKCIEAESKFTHNELQCIKFAQEMEDIRTKLSISNNTNEGLVLVSKFAMVCKEHGKALDAIEYARGRMKKLSEKKMQKIPSLDELKANFDVIINPVKIQDDLPEALISIREFVLKQVKKHDSDHVRNEPKEPNPMDEILKSFAIDNKKIN